MKPAMSKAPLFSMFVLDHLWPQPDGTVVAVNPDGTSVSVQPDGSIQSRPAGTAGEWEKAVLVDGNLVYYPSGQPTSQPFVFAYTANVPNT